MKCVRRREYESTQFLRKFLPISLVHLFRQIDFPWRYLFFSSSLHHRKATEERLYLRQIFKPDSHLFIEWESVRRLNRCNFPSVTLPPSHDLELDAMGFAALHSWLISHTHYITQIVHISIMPKMNLVANKHTKHDFCLFLFLQRIHVAIVFDIRFFCRSVQFYSRRVFYLPQLI